MKNSSPLAAGGIGALHPMTDFHDVAAVRGRFNAYGREEEIEPGDLIGWAVNNLMLRVCLDIILVGISNVRNADGEVVIGSDINRKMECRFC